MADGTDLSRLSGGAASLSRSLRPGPPLEDSNPTARRVALRLLGSCEGYRRARPTISAQSPKPMALRLAPIAPVGRLLRDVGVAMLLILLVRKW